MLHFNEDTRYHGATQKFRVKSLSLKDCVVSISSLENSKSSIGNLARRYFEKSVKMLNEVK
jgi:hypothetical protein